LKNIEVDVCPFEAKGWCEKCVNCSFDCPHECLGSDCNAIDCVCDACNDFCADQASELKIICSEYWSDYAASIQER
jgi:hypothetical protein